MTRIGRLSFFVLLALLFAAPTALAQPEAIVDEDYRFRLDPPGPGWRMLPEEDVQKLVPDAVAGAMKAPGSFGVVIVEDAPGVEVEAFARLTLDNMPVEQPEIHEFGKIRFLDREAARFQVSGTVNGMRVTYRSVVLVHQGYAFQILSWSPEFRAKQSELERFAKAFSLLPGEIRGRSKTRVVADIQGVGWRVKDGVFESAAYGIAVEPKGEWRLAVAAELNQMNPDAEIGLVHSAPEGYVAVVAERAAGSDRAAFARMVRESGTQEMGAVLTGEPYVVKTVGRDVLMHRYVTQGSPSIVFHKSAFFVGDMCMQVVAWHLKGLGDKLKPFMSQAFSAIRLLDKAERGRLEEALKNAPDPQESVGQGYALRDGLYRSFEFGFTWEAPVGWWRLTAGHDARQENADATLLIESPATGLNGTIVAEGAQGLSADAYHRLVVGGVFGEDAPEAKADPRKVSLGKAEGRVSRGSVTVDSAKFDFHILTTVYQGRALQLVLYGTSGNLQSAPTEILAAIGALRVHRELRPVAQQGEAIEDWRLGYAIRPPGAGWKYKDITPSAIRSIASLHTWTRGRMEIVGLGLCALQEGQDAEWFENFLTRTFRSRLGILATTPPQRAKAKLGGRDAARLEWRVRTQKVVVYVVNRGCTFYALVTVWPAAGADPSESEVPAGFRLLD